MDKRKAALKEALLDGVYPILQLLKDMEDKEEKETVVFGELDGPFFSSAVYSCTIRIGFEDEPR